MKNMGFCLCMFRPGPGLFFDKITDHLFLLKIVQVACGSKIIQGETFIADDPAVVA